MSHNPETFEKWISLKDVQMLLVSFFEIPYVEKLAKNVRKRYVQVIPRSTVYVPEEVPLLSLHKHSEQYSLLELVLQQSPPSKSHSKLLYSSSQKSSPMAHFGHSSVLKVEIVLVDVELLLTEELKVLLVENVDDAAK